MFSHDPSIRLDEYAKDEWRDICHHVRPDISSEEFDGMWDEFCEMKRKREAN